ncbi:MAG: Nmad3 family putative nucleotide modification protein [Hasllibacter sp.]
MRLVLSRKGVDSAAGGCGSPVVDGRCRSIPIPTPRGLPSDVLYGDLDLPAPVEALTGGRLTGTMPCHPDPAFHAGRAALGQLGAAQSHLARGGVGPGDLFLFFGLFGGGRARAHRIFGWLRVERVLTLPGRPEPADPIGQGRPHPHTRGDLCEWPATNAIYVGTGTADAPADDDLRLTVPGGPPTRWRVPDFLRETGLTYHDDPARWAEPGRLRAAPRGQEFVADLTHSPEGRAWAEAITDRIPAKEPA